MSDERTIQERLRDGADDRCGLDCCYGDVMKQAADRIDALTTVARNAAAIIDAHYQWLERVEKAGGATCVEGISVCNSMLKSLRKNAARTDDLVMKPLRAALNPKDL